MTHAHPVLARIAVAAVCVYGPFAAAPWLSDLAADPELRAAWFWLFPVLPGLLAGRLFGSGDEAFWLSSGATTLGWIVLLVALTRRSYGAALISLLFAAALAAWTVAGFRA
jgi:hypothetical protein